MSVKTNNLETETDCEDSSLVEHASPPAEQVVEATEVSGAVSGTQGSPSKARSRPAARRVSLSLTLRGVVISLVIAVLVAAVCILTWLYLKERTDVENGAIRAANDRRAEQIAMDYAVAAATIDFQDLGPWKAQLVKGTTKDLSETLTNAAKSMEQILAPLQWTSTAQPLAAKVRTDTDGIYVVDTFVSVHTKTVQATEPLDSTATYSITIDSNNDWQISDVGGVGAVVGGN